MECKYYSFFIFYYCTWRFILTIWNVNIENGDKPVRRLDSFILTIWNVNIRYI